MTVIATSFFVVPAWGMRWWRAWWYPWQKGHGSIEAGPCERVALAGRRISPPTVTTDRLRQMPVPQSVLAAQSPRLLLPCLAFTQGSRHLAQQNHLSRSYRPVQRRPAKPTSLPHHPGFPADLAKLLTFNFQRSTDNRNLKNDISLLLPPTSLPTAILLNHPVRHPPSTASPPPPSTTASATAPPSIGSSTSTASRPPPPAPSSTTPAAPATPTTSRA